MKGIKQQVVNFLQLSKKEIRGLFVLFFILGVVLLLPSIQKKFRPIPSSKVEEEQVYLDSIAEILLLQSVSDSSNKINPNSLSYFQWLDLGASKELANNILKTKKRLRGFQCLDQFKSIQGITNSTIENYYHDFSIAPTCPIKKEKLKPIALNTITHQQLKAIYGVSNKTAQRVVNYRTSLGGYYSTLQLKEVHKITSKELKLLTSRSLINKTQISKININSVNFFKLKKHPYLSGKQASKIINYRKKIKRYNNIQQLKKVYNLSKKDINRISPYINFD